MSTITGINVGILSRIIPETHKCTEVNAYKFETHEDKQQQQKQK